MLDFNTKICSSYFFVFDRIENFVFCKIPFCWTYARVGSTKARECRWSSADLPKVNFSSAWNKSCHPCHKKKLRWWLSFPTSVKTFALTLVFFVSRQSKIALRWRFCATILSRSFEVFYYAWFQYEDLFFVFFCLWQNRKLRFSHKWLIFFCYFDMIILSCGYGGMADALDLGSSPQGCRFKSCYPHQVKTKSKQI